MRLSGFFVWFADLGISVFLHDVSVLTTVWYHTQLCGHT